MLNSKSLQNLLLYSAIFVFLIFIFFPFYWMIITSLKTDQELYSLESVPLLIKQDITLDHYRLLFQQTEFVKWFKNSIIVAGIVTPISVIISTLAAYSLTRMRFWGSNFFGISIFVTYLVPPTLLFIPLYAVISHLGLGDSLGALILTYPTFNVPFCTWLLMSYFKGIPKELEESAMIDGASRWGALLKIVIPVALPGIVTVTLFSFTLCWGEFTYGLAFISSSDKKILSVGIASELVRGDVFFWGTLMGGAILASVPVVLFFTMFTKYFVSGLTAGATRY
ncbi:MAG: carbohydrate ABC transporter permease [Deltaproteobacteria bacterium]|nr:carbohydrate ABC transporter permease [Deltaproteobacteria bacterium]MBW1961016.1 carbohydrate ABC transporter permease [Deltaproteobacteria bacterium]MBW2152783.1 carbohydrate ABC transporter permease [Deltaproteobacteria bacterium]